MTPNPQADNLDGPAGEGPAHSARDSVIRVAGMIVSLAALAVIVARFGIGEQLDAYYWAWTIPHLISVAVALAISRVVLPGLLYVFDQHGRSAMYEALGPIVLWTLAVLLGIAVLVAAVAGFAQYQMGRPVSLVMRILPWLLAAVALSSAAGMMAAALRVGGKTLTHALMPLAEGVCVIASVMLLGGCMGVTAVAVGFAVGGAAKLALAAGGCFADGLRMLPTLFNRTAPATIQIPEGSEFSELTRGGAGVVSWLLSVVFGHGVGADADVIILRLLGGLLGPGVVAVLGLAQSVFQTIEAVPLGIIGCTVEPGLARLTASDDPAALTARLRDALRTTFGWLLPLSLCGAVAGRPLARLIFGEQPGPLVGTLGVLLAMYMAVMFFSVASKLLLLVIEQAGNQKDSAQVLELTAGTRAVLMSAFAVAFGSAGREFGTIGIGVAVAAGSAAAMGLALAVIARLGHNVVPGISGRFLRLVLPAIGSMIAAAVVLWLVGAQLGDSAGANALAVLAAMGLGLAAGCFRER